MQNYILKTPVFNKTYLFVINKGEKVAITRMNGAGKSTFLKTLLRFYKNKGEILIDDIPIEKIDPRAIRETDILVFQQDSHIFNNTVMYNLGYPQHKKDEEEVIRICKEYELDEFFKNMKHGYSTETGERGKSLSGGQKQRVNLNESCNKEFSDNYV